MIKILKPIFEWLTGNYNLFDNIFYNNLVMAVVGLLAFTVAWNFVGSLYSNNLISGSGAGSIIHWVVRFIAFVVLFSIISIIIWFVKLIISIPVWVYYALLGIFIISIVGVTIRYFVKKKFGTKK